MTTFLETPTFLDMTPFEQELNEAQNKTGESICNHNNTCEDEEDEDEETGGKEVVYETIARFTPLTQSDMGAPEIEKINNALKAMPIKLRPYSYTDVVQAEKSEELRKSVEYSIEIFAPDAVKTVEGAYFKPTYFGLWVKGAHWTATMDPEAEEGTDEFVNFRLSVSIDEVSTEEVSTSRCADDEPATKKSKY
jgi:hypothetical protein